MVQYDLLWRLADAKGRVKEVLNLWKTVSSRSGRGLKQFYLNTLKVKLPAVLLAQRKCAEEQLVLWYNDTLANLERGTLSVFAQLQAVLEPLCNVTTISPEKRAFFEELLAPIEVLNQRPDVKDPSPTAEHGVLNTGEPNSLTDIHTLHPCLTPLPTAWVKQYNNITISRPGSVYVMTNPSFRHDLFKIGLTTRPLENRAKQLYTTGVPQPFDIKHHWATDNCRIFESLMHKLFADVRENKKREFFQADLELIIEVGNALHGILQPRA